MRNRIINNWTLPRILRVIIGMVIIGEAVSRAEVITGIAGAIFTGMGVFNLGCCGSGVCYAPVKSSKTHVKDISFEEVD